MCTFLKILLILAFIEESYIPIPASELKLLNSTYQVALDNSTVRLCKNENEKSK